MNEGIKQRLIDLKLLLKNKDLTEKQHFIICNKLDRLTEFINGVV